MARRNPKVFFTVWCLKVPSVNCNISGLIKLKLIWLNENVNIFVVDCQAENSDYELTLSNKRFLFACTWIFHYPLLEAFGHRSASKVFVCFIILRQLSEILSLSITKDQELQQPHFSIAIWSVRTRNTQLGDPQTKTPC